MCRRPRWLWRAGGGEGEKQGFLVSGGVTAALTGEQCSPNFIHWTYDTYMLSKSTGGAMVKAGGDFWYFLTADYAFGKQLQSEHDRPSAGSRR